MNKKLIKSRSSRQGTLEAMACVCACGDLCANCSGGGSFYMQKYNRYGGDALSKSAFTPGKRAAG